MIAYEDFVAAFPEFGVASTYTPEKVTLWIDDGYLAFDPSVFGARLDLLVMLYVAHNLTLDGQNMRAGAQIGATSGPIASKSIGGVSVSYDVGATITQNAGIYNGTSYGQRLVTMVQGMARGGFYRLPKTKIGYVRGVF